MSKSLESQSKFLSLILRHTPERIGLTLDSNGWADLSLLLQLANSHGTNLTHESVLEIVATSDKKRFALNADQSKIRASQGHSIRVDLGFEPKPPPEFLFHGTASRFLDSIRAQGLQPGDRQHVHLSSTESTAIEVGQRHGKPIVLKIDALIMHSKGHQFYLSENGVWLTASVPQAFIQFP